MTAWRFGLVCALTIGMYSAGFAKAEPADRGAEMLGSVRRVFRAHEAPPYVSYTITRETVTAEGMRDFTWSYSYRIWFRTSDHAALGRRIFRGRFGPLEFMRPAFNEPRDPGPPTADLFEKAPARPHFDIHEVDPLPAWTVIGSVRAIGEFDYRVSRMDAEGSLVHLTLVPRRDAERNRPRELWIDGQTLEIKKVVATDRLYVLGGPVYQMLDTITMGMQEGRPVVTDIHAHAEIDADDGDAYDCDYHFSDIAFLPSMPSWYFEPATYGAHFAQAPP